MWAFMPATGYCRLAVPGWARSSNNGVQALLRLRSARAEGIEVEAGEGAVETLRERRVPEGACCRRCADELGDVQVHAVEVRDTVLGGHRGAEEAHLLDDLSDRGGWPAGGGSMGKARWPLRAVVTPVTATDA